MDILESGIGELIQPFDMDEFREWNRTQKSRKLVDKRMSQKPLTVSSRMAAILVLNFMEPCVPR